MSIESEIDALVRIRTLNKLLKIIGEDTNKQKSLLSNYFKNYNCEKIFEKKPEISCELSQFVYLKIIESNPDKQWDWEWISKNSKITIEFIEANPDKPWNWKWIKEYKFKNYIDKEKEKLMNRHKIIKSRLEKRIKNGCKYSKSIL